MIRLLFLMVLLTACLPAAAMEALLLTVEITGADSEGVLKLAVFATEDSFENQQDPVAAIDLLPQPDGTVQIDLPLEPGRYAVAVFQDADRDGKLTTNFIGLPTEKYGFSGMPARFGPPAFADAAFEFPATGRIAIRLEKL